MTTNIWKINFLYNIITTESSKEHLVFNIISLTISSNPQIVSAATLRTLWLCDILILLIFMHTVFVMQLQKKSLKNPHHHHSGGEVIVQMSVHWKNQSLWKSIFVFAATSTTVKECWDIWRENYIQEKVLHTHTHKHTHTESTMVYLYPPRISIIIAFIKHFTNKVQKGFIFCFFQRNLIKTWTVIKTIIKVDAAETELSSFCIRWVILPYQNLAST